MLGWVKKLQKKIAKVYKYILTSENFLGRKSSNSYLRGDQYESGNTAMSYLPSSSPSKYFRR